MARASGETLEFQDGCFSYFFIDFPSGAISSWLLHLALCFFTP